MMKHLAIKALLPIILLIIMLSSVIKAAPIEVRFNYWRMGTDPQKTIMNKIINNFEAKNPGIKILVEPTPQNSVVDVLTTQILAGAPPDVSVIANSDIARFEMMGGLEPLNQYIDSDKSF